MFKRSRVGARMFRRLSAVGMALGVSLSAAALDLEPQVYIEAYNMNADLSKNGGQLFNFQKPLAEIASVAGTSVTLNAWKGVCESTQADKDTYWGCDGSGPSTSYGKVFLDVYTYENQTTAVAQTGSFKGCFGGLLDDDAGYTVEAYVKIFNQDYSQTWYEAFQPGICYDIPYTIDGTATVQFQKGFRISGPNALATYNKNATAYIGATALPGPASANRPADAIPTLPLTALLGLITALGLFAGRRLKT